MIVFGVLGQGQSGFGCAWGKLPADSFCGASAACGLAGRRVECAPAGASLRKIHDMTLTDEQKQQIASWIEEGLKPSDIQSRLETAFGLRVTYMDVRFLIDDLKLTLKDPEPAETPELPATPEPSPVLAPEAAPAGGAGGVQVKVDPLTKVGTLASGRVTFSDGKVGDWYVDQMGRLGMVPPEPGYRPAQADIAEFQVALDKELARLGL